eukprot:6184425-Pleurochrysis_carterae.AAC.3
MQHRYPDLCGHLRHPPPAPSTRADVALPTMFVVDRGCIYPVHTSSCSSSRAGARTIYGTYHVLREEAAVVLRYAE